MKSKINTKELSDLARLSFTKEELCDFEKDMENIVSFAKKITEADTVFFSPSSEGETVLRRDELQEKIGISLQDVAPKGGFREDFFAVPRVVD